MKTVSTYDFTNRFATFSHQKVQVRKRGKVVGTWLPAPKSPEPVDVMQRLKRNFTRPLPFTGAEVLKAGKKR